MFVVFDIESTGLSTTACDIIQFAYCMFDGNNQFVRAENLYFYYEGMSWSQEAADASHQLSLEFLKQYEDQFEANLLKMYSVLNRANVIGHNSNHFDCPFVKNWLARMGLEDFQFGIKQDTMLAFKPITKRARIKLTKLTEMMGVSKESVKYFAELWFKDAGIRGPHDAAYDVVSTSMLALMGLAKNVISFNVNAAPSIVEVSDINGEYEEVIVDKPVDMIGYIVHLFDDNETDRYCWVNHDRNAYRALDVLTGDEQQNYLASNPYLDVNLYKKEDGSYSGEHNGTTYIYTPGDKDTVQVVTPYVTMYDKDIDILGLIEHNFKSGGA